MFRAYEERDFVIIAVAFDSGGAAAVREFIRPALPIVVPPPMRAIMGWSDEQYDTAATPTYPCLIDEQHIVAELYGMHNVPMAVWIDESGRIVRPPEPAGATDGFRRMDRQTYTLPADVAADGRAARARYLAAIRDWIENGADSAYALSADEARERIAGPSAAEAHATACFRLGQYLHAHGQIESAQRWFDEAQRASPDHWTFFRQALHLQETGKASGPEFARRVAALGDRSYYPEIVLERSGPA